MIDLETHRARSNPLFLALLWLHVPLNAIVAWYCAAPWMLIGGATAACALVATAVWRAGGHAVGGEVGEAEDGAGAGPELGLDGAEGDAAAVGGRVQAVAREAAGEERLPRARRGAAVAEVAGERALRLPQGEL